MDIPETNLFGELLKQFRARSSFTQETLAYAIGQQSRGNIQAWEACQYPPRKRETVLALARALRLTDNETDKFLLAAHHPQEYHTQGPLASGTERNESSHLTNMDADEKDETPIITIPICDYTPYIKEKTHNFVGRQFVFDAVTHFTTKYSRGYFFIRGEPGIGKSALAAQMVKSGGYVHHFNIRSEGMNTTEIFLKNICAQLIVTYTLPYTELPAETTANAHVLTNLLHEISDKRKPEEKVIIVIDALDEVDNNRISVGANLLYLPSTLPQGIYIIATTRKMSFPLRIECEQDTLEIEHDSQENREDIHTHLEQVTKQEGIQNYIQAQDINNSSFIQHLQEKSDGNFIYLRYVIPEIEHGVYQDLGLHALPNGLKNYYEDHWQRMRRKNEQNDEIWFRYKLPVIMALVVTKAPISIDLIAQYSGVEERPRMREILHEWGQFFHEEQTIYQGETQKRYRLYHLSFYDFIAKKEEIADERVSIQKALKKMGNAMLSQWV